MSAQLLLFDVDGTLMLSANAGMRAMSRTAQALFGEGFRWDGIEAAGHLDPLIFREAATLNRLPNPDAEHVRFHARYIAELEAEFLRAPEQARAMPGVLALLDELLLRREQRGDLEVGVLTGNYAAAAPIKLRAIGVDTTWFGVSAFGDEGPDRPALVELAMRKYARRHGRAVDPARVIVIGDTPRDMHCARAHGCVAFGVGTGSYSVSDLLNAGADHAVENLADPTPLRALLG